jgi:hypothetical protein
MKTAGGPKWKTYILLLAMQFVGAMAFIWQRKVDVRGLGSKVCRGPPPQSARASSLRCDRSRSGHPARLAGYLGGQVINSGEEQFENRRGVCLVVT